MRTQLGIQYLKYMAQLNLKKMMIWGIISLLLLLVIYSMLPPLKPLDTMDDLAMAAEGEYFDLRGKKLLCTNVYSQKQGNAEKYSGIIEYVYYLIPVEDGYGLIGVEGGIAMMGGAPLGKINGGIAKARPFTPYETDNWSLIRRQLTDQLGISGTKVDNTIYMSILFTRSGPLIIDTAPWYIQILFYIAILGTLRMLLRWRIPSLVKAYKKGMQKGRMEFILNSLQEEINQQTIWIHAGNIIISSRFAIIGQEILNTANIIQLDTGFFGKQRMLYVKQKKGRKISLLLPEQTWDALTGQLQSASISFPFKVSFSSNAEATASK